MLWATKEKVPEVGLASYQVPLPEKKKKPKPVGRWDNLIDAVIVLTLGYLLLCFG